MMRLTSGQTRVTNTQLFIDEINELIHRNLDKNWMAGEWNRLENGEDIQRIHPLVRVAFRAHGQIEYFVRSGVGGITPEIWELAELAIKINALKRSGVRGIENRLSKLTSTDFSLYRTARYEIQIAGMLLHRGHKVEFIEERGRKTPDILVRNDNGMCEMECKHKEPTEDQIDYVRSIYNNTQTARKQFSKNCPGAILIEVEKPRFDEFEVERKRLAKEMERAMRNSSSISAIFLTSKVDIEEGEDFVYRHRVSGLLNKDPRYSLPSWLLANLLNA
jgi:hypothetical protein